VLLAVVFRKAIAVAIVMFVIGVGIGYWAAGTRVTTVTNTLTLYTPITTTAVARETVTMLTTIAVSTTATVTQLQSTTVTMTRTATITMATTATVTHTLTRAPVIESIEYRDRVGRGEAQEIKLVVVCENPYRAVLRLNTTAIDIPLTEKTGNRAKFSTSFNPSKYFDREGIVYGDVTVYDKEGTYSSKNLSFLVNLEKPKIDVNIKKVGFGKYELYANVSDENLEDVKLFLNGKELNLLEENGLYKALIEVYEDSDFTLVARDRFGLESKFSGNIFVSKDNPNAYYALKRGLDPKYINLILP
jgi:hypothetical protein